MSSKDFFPQHDPYNPQNDAVPAQAKQDNILTEAYKVIYGDREKTYGSPGKNLFTIAKMWTAYLGLEHQLSSDDVCVMMILLKAARLANSPDHRDSQVDICGYAALMERVQNFRKEESK